MNKQTTYQVSISPQNSTFYLKQDAVQFKTRPKIEFSRNM